MTLEDLSEEDIRYLYPWECTRCGRRIKYDEGPETTTVRLAPVCCTLAGPPSPFDLCNRCTQDLLDFLKAGRKGGA